MKVTVCQFHDQISDEEWDSFQKHVAREQSELVVLPEMPFSPWIARTAKFDEATWQEAVAVHQRNQSRIKGLFPARVIGSFPVNRAGQRLNEGFYWDRRQDWLALHHKTYLPEEEDFWEATWFDRGKVDFQVTNIDNLAIGMQLCTEMWFYEHARAYGKQGINLLACPRATGLASADKWLAGGRVAAVVSGAFCLSSNRGGRDAQGFAWGGQGWIIDPEEGEVVALTSEAQPWQTVKLDLSRARQAKQTYPRYVIDGK